MQSKFGHYNLELEEVLIGTPAPSGDDGHIETILEQIRSRQIAEEQIATYALKERAAQKERELREAEARAEQQRHITESELGISIQANRGKADTARVREQAEQTRVLADAEAQKTRRLAEADAERAARVGVADLAQLGKVTAAGNFRYFETYNVVALLYLTMTVSLSLLLRRFEERVVGGA